MSIAHPIVRPSQMRHSISWHHADPAEKERMNQGYNWCFEYTGQELTEAEKNHLGKLDELRKRLLSFGGDTACMPIHEEDLGNIMTRGQFFYGDHARMRKGEPCRCHSNSSLLWNANRGKCQIATGYALSEDGIWRQHSWGVQPLTLSWRVWETTQKRVAYFGFVMTDEECEEFYFDNI